MRTIYFYFLLFFTSILKIPKFNKLKRKKSTMEQSEYYKQTGLVAKSWAHGLIKASGTKVTLIGLENIPKDETVLFISNHQGNFDTLLYLTCINRPIGFIGKIELSKIPIISSWMKELGCLFIDRKDIKQSAKTILKGIDILKSGHSLVVCPEGTRSKCKEMGTFKRGTFKLATKPKITIVPITVNGSYKIMEGNRRNKITPSEVSMTIHKPIYTRDLTPEELKSLPTKVEQIIKSSLK